MVARPLRIAVEVRRGFHPSLGAGVFVLVACVAFGESFADDPTLHELAARGDPARIALLINRGEPVDVRDAAGRTPLHVAAERAHLFAAMMLLAKGADPNARDAEKQTPLHLAAGGDSSTDGERMQIVKVLIAKGSDRAARDAHGKRPVDYATRAEIRQVLEP